MAEAEAGKRVREDVALGLMLVALGMLRLVLLPAYLVYCAVEWLRRPVR